MPGSWGGAVKERDRAFAKLCSEWQLLVHNPSLRNDEAKDLRLSLRERTVSIRTGSTRHDAGTGRAIDLVLSTGDLCPSVTIHNGLHCGGATGVCKLPLCYEFARGDHFLVEAIVPVGCDLCGERV